MDVPGERVMVLGPEASGFDAVLASWLETLILDGLIQGRPAERPREPRGKRPF